MIRYIKRLENTGSSVDLDVAVFTQIFQTY